MSLHELPPFSGGKPGFPAPPPASPPSYPLPDDSLPLPDHFPEPYVDAESESRSSRTSTILETGATLVYCSTQRGSDVTQHVQPVSVNGPMVVDEAKEGIRRITDKYAAPETLLRNSSGSVSRSSAGGTTRFYQHDSTGQFLRPISGSSTSTSPLPSTPTAVSPHPDPYAAENMYRLHVAGNSDSRGSLQGVGSSAFSDASSDVSSASPVPPWTGKDISGPIVTGEEVGSRVQSMGGVSMASLGEGVTEQDVQQVEMFYKSHSTEVTVCHSLANLYFGSAVSSSSSDPSPGASGSAPASGSDSWEFVNTGIPLLVLDSGKHHRARQLSIVLAEKGTGFVLWRDMVSHLTRYTCPHANFHTLRVSSDSNKLAGLSFDDSKAAADFAATFKQLTSDPDDDLLNLSKKGKKKKKKQESKKYKPPKKTDISQPCCFQHVTKLERPQIGGMMPPPPNGFPPSATSSSMSSLSDVFHNQMSLSTSRTRSQSSELSMGSSGRSDH